MKDRSGSSARRYAILHKLGGIEIDERKYFTSLEQFIKSIPKGAILYAILYDRISTNAQAKKNTHLRRKPEFIQMVIKIARELGREINIAGYFAEFCRGYVRCMNERKELINATKQVKKILDNGGHGAIVALAVNRLVRSSCYDFMHNRDAKLLKSDVNYLQNYFSDIPFTVLLDPGMPEEKVIEWLGKMGQDHPNKKIGRPKKKKYNIKAEKKETFQFYAKQLKDQGVKFKEISATINEISDEFFSEGVPDSTLRDWINEDDIE